MLLKTYRSLKIKNSRNFEAGKSTTNSTENLCRGSRGKILKSIEAFGYRGYTETNSCFCDALSMTITPVSLTHQTAPNFFNNES